MRLIKTILFDLNNVGENYLSYMRDFGSVRLAVLQRACVQLGMQLSESQFSGLVDEYTSIGDTIFHHHPAFWQHLFETLIKRGLSYAEIERLYSVYLDIYQEKITAYPDFLEAIRESRNRGFKTGIVANGNTARVYRFLEKFGIRERFDTVVISGGTPFAKPGREIFDLALLNLRGPAPLETVFIGDRLENDVAGANRSGMWSVRLLRPGTEEAQPTGSHEVPDFTIENLDQLFSLQLFEFKSPVTSAVIACGGRGSRMGSLTEGIQKCMIEIKGKPVLALLVETLLTMGVRDIHFLLGYRALDIERYFEERPSSFNAHFHHTDAKSTGDAVMKVIANLPGRFIYSHGNIVFGRDLLSGLLKHHYKSSRTSTFAVTKRPIAKTHPIFVLDRSSRNGYPVDILRHPTDSQRTSRSFSYSIGLGIISKDDLSIGCPQAEVTTEQLLNGAIDKVSLFKYPGEWVHLENGADIDKLNSIRKTPDAGARSYA